MGRKPRIDRSPEEKWQIVQEASRAETSRRRVGVTGSLRICSIAGRMKRNRERRPALGGRSAAAAETEKDHRIRQLERTLGGRRWRSKS